MHKARRHAHSSLRATDTMPRPYHAFACDTKPHGLAQHKASDKRRVARTSTGCYTRGRTRTRYAQCVPIRLATSMKHHSIIREPYQAHASHEAARIGSSYALGRVSVFVSVRRFGEDSTDRCLGVVRFFSENSVEWVRCSSRMHTLWCPWCRLAMPRLMPSVSRMGLCGSLFVVRHSLCQLVSFFQRVRNFSFDLSLRKFKFESTSSDIRVGIRSGVRVSGCAGVWECW